MSEPTPIPTTTTTPASNPTKKLITQAAAVIAALAGGFAVAKFSDTHKGPAPVEAADNNPSATNVAAPGKPQRQIQVVNLFECQYIVTENPFFMVHLPRCTNHPAGK